MSRGLGKCQQAIIAKLEESAVFYLVDVLPAKYTPAAYQSVYRAAMRLRDEGKIQVRTYAYGASKIVISKTGSVIGQTFRPPAGIRHKCLGGAVGRLPKHLTVGEYDRHS